MKTRRDRATDPIGVGNSNVSIGVALGKTSMSRGWWLEALVLVWYFRQEYR